MSMYEITTENIIVYSLIVIILTAIGTYCLYYPQVPERKIEYYDCGSSDFCFSTQARTCSPAKATITVSGEMLNQKLVFEETVEGFDNGNCILTLTYTEETTMPFLAGLDMTCKVPRDKLGNFKDYLQGQKMTEACEGPIVDVASRMV